MSSKAAAPPTKKRLFRLWRAPVAWLLGAALAGGLASCVTTQEGPQASAEETAPRETSGSALAAADSSVRAVQLYAGEDERRLPVLALGTGERLTLEFDLMAQQGRPLSVYFYHAGRTWKRDPAPARFLDGFRSDDLLDYTSARARGVPYVHYTYRFPEEGDVGFEASGNYILRVTEQGREDDVLFERPFFVTEEAGAMELHLDELRRGTQPGLAVRPTVRYRIPAELGRSSFNFAACFVPDERLRRGRCVERPESSGPRRKLTFELPYRESFAPGTESFFLDLSRLSPGGGIAGVNRDRTPYRVRLETDHADFAEAGRPPLVGGQPVVRGAGIAAAEPALSAEYASVRFRFVPPGGRKLRGPVVLAGSVHEGPLEDAPRLGWNSAEGYYEGRVLLKQGLYEYHYASPDPALRRTLSQSRPPARRRYAAFVYYRDAALGSDRLLRVRRSQAE
ncbi:MAG: DUF5103 domain-containing protein [Bacteroidetes bacterium QS_8_68_28]|nr:MAG: DUF5103 domain-containing protein [Bacteroidetes bacterium QS_8_68_28]